MLCRHRWKTLSHRQIEVYESSRSARPIKVKTEFSQVCEKCGKPRVRTIKGGWEPD